MQQCLLRFYPQASKRNLFLIVLIPLFIFVLGFLAFRSSQEKPPKPSNDPPLFIPYSKIELFDATLHLGSSESTLSGRIRGHFDETVTEVRLSISLFDGLEMIDGTSTTIALEIPPGEARSFTKTISGLREKPGWKWDYRIMEVRGKKGMLFFSLGVLIADEAFKSLSPQNKCNTIRGHISMYGAPPSFPAELSPTLDECIRVKLEELMRAGKEEDPGVKPPEEKRDGR